MECVYTALTIWQILVYAVRNPSGTVSTDNLDRFPLLLAQKFHEERKDSLTFSLMHPDHSIVLMVDYHGEILMAFTVAGFIYADNAEAI